MSTIQDNDQFLVQRGTNSYKQSAKDLMSTIQDTDLMLIQRGEDSYKVTCEDVKDQLGSGGPGGDPVISVNCTLVASSDYQPSTLTATEPTVINGTKVESYPAWYKDDVEIAGATGLTYQVTDTGPGVYMYKERWVGVNGVSVFPTGNNQEIEVAKPAIVTRRWCWHGTNKYKPVSAAIDNIATTGSTDFSMSFLVIGGGGCNGAGSNQNTTRDGGGGAGGMISGWNGEGSGGGGSAQQPIPVSTTQANGTFTFAVGKGGSSSANNGDQSFLRGTDRNGSSVDITAAGGGYGGTGVHLCFSPDSRASGAYGGSGGGGAYGCGSTTSGASGMSGQGYSGLMLALGMAAAVVELEVMPGLAA